MSNPILRISTGEPRLPTWKGPSPVVNVPEPAASLVYDECPACGILITVSRLDLWETSLKGTPVHRLGAVHPNCVREARAKRLPLPTGAFTAEQVRTLQDARQERQRALCAPIGSA